MRVVLFLKIIFSTAFLSYASLTAKPQLTPPLGEIENAFSAWRQQQTLFRQPVKAFYQSIPDLISTISSLLAPLPTNRFYSSANPTLDGTKDTLNQLLSAHEKLLLQQANNDAEQAFHFSNQLFEHYIKNNPLEFIFLHSDKKAAPFLSFLYSIFWLQFCQKGWNFWSHECLQSLATQQQEKKVIYIAGGFDIFYPLDYGIQNIIIIDPFLPTQQRYYPAHYNYFLQGKPHDSFSVTSTLRLQRVASNVGGWFSTNSYAKFPSITSTWNIDSDNGSKGLLTFLRTTISNQHLADYKNELFLISFNELFYLITPPYLGGWDIDIAALPETFLLFVKQLHKPLTKQNLMALRTSYILNAVELQFLALGNDIT